VLSGLASLKMLDGNPSRSRETELGFLKDTLTRELAGESG